MAVIGATQIEPVNILGSYVQGRELGRANQLARQQEMERAFEVEQQQKIQNALAGGLDIRTPEGQAALMKFGPQGLAMAAQGAQLGQYDFQAKQAQRAAAKEKLGELIGILRFGEKDDASYAAAYRTAQARGFDMTGVPTTRDPAYIKSQLQSLIPLQDQLELEMRQQTAEIQRGQLDVSRGELDLQRRELRLKEKAAQSGVKEDEDVVARTETAADGTVRMYNKYGKLLKTEAGAGKPSATYEKTKAVQRETARNLDEVISSLEDVSKDGGLIDQSTGSGLGRAVDVAAGFFGQSTPGAEAIAELQPIADQVLKLVPRFEGPQSDKDTQSYRQAAGQLGDPTLPSNVRKKAARKILEIYKKRRSQFTLAGEELNTAPSEGWGSLEVVR
jgi:hypothetical protein